MALALAQAASRSSSSQRPARLRQRRVADTRQTFAAYIEIRYVRWRDARRTARGPL